MDTTPAPPPPPPPPPKPSSASTSAKRCGACNELVQFVVSSKETNGRLGRDECPNLGKKMSEYLLLRTHYYERAVPKSKTCPACSKNALPINTRLCICGHAFNATAKRPASTGVALLTAAKLRKASATLQKTVCSFTGPLTILLVLIFGVVWSVTHCITADFCSLLSDTQFQAAKSGVSFVGVVLGASNRVSTLPSTEGCSVGKPSTISGAPVYSNAIITQSGTSAVLPPLLCQVVLQRIGPVASAQLFESQVILGDSPANPALSLLPPASAPGLLRAMVFVSGCRSGCRCVPSCIPPGNRTCRTRAARDHHRLNRSALGRRSLRRVCASAVRRRRAHVFSHLPVL